jgi:hypothetical protein
MYANSEGTPLRPPSENHQHARQLRAEAARLRQRARELREASAHVVQLARNKAQVLLFTQYLRERPLECRRNRRR